MTTTEEQKKLLSAGELLPVMEDFYTLQGEGFHTGKAAYFLRIGGCDVGCHWCDVKESWNAELHPLTQIEKIIDRARPFASRTIVITGGEPLQYNLDKLCTRFKAEGFQTHIETSGAFSLSGQWDWICLSPKKNSPPKPELFKQADELKIIVHNQHDFIWAEENAAKVSDQCKLYLQPEWSKREQMIPKIVDYISNHPKWIASLQTHKYMRIP